MHFYIRVEPSRSPFLSRKSFRKRILTSAMLGRKLRSGDQHLTMIQTTKNKKAETQQKLTESCGLRLLGYAASQFRKTYPFCKPVRPSTRTHAYTCTPSEEVFEPFRPVWGQPRPGSTKHHPDGKGGGNGRRNTEKTKNNEAVDSSSNIHKRKLYREVNCQP